MFASASLGIFLVVVMVAWAVKWIFRRRELPDEDPDIPEDLQIAIDRWDEIQERHSHSTYWDG